MDAAQDDNPEYVDELEKTWECLYAAKSQLISSLDCVTRAQERASVGATHERLLRKAEELHDESLLNQMIARGRIGGTAGLLRFEKILQDAIDRLQAEERRFRADDPISRAIDGLREADRKKGRGR